MIRKLILCSLILICSGTFSQNNKLDSLLGVLGKTAHDTTRFNTLIEIAYVYQDLKPDSAIYYHEQAEKIAGRIGDNLRIAQSIWLKGQDYFLLGDFDKALGYFNTSSTLALKQTEVKEAKLQMKAKRLYCSILGNTGLVYMMRGEYPAALDYYFKSLKMAEETGNKNVQSNNLGNIGIVYDEQSDYPKALEFYLRAQKLDEELGNKQGQAANLGNIGVVYENMEEYDKALEFFHRALEISEETGSKGAQADNLGNIGIVLRAQGKLISSLEYLRKAIAISEETGDKNSISVNLGNIASVFRAQGNVFKTNIEFSVN